MYIYFPSCNFRKWFPETAEKVEAYIATQPDVKIAGCCHLTNDLPEPGDTIVTQCMSCMRGLEEIRPDVPVIGFFEFLLTRNDVPWPDLHGEEITVQDCFRARGKHEMQDAVRECLIRCNAVPAEMEGNRDLETYDGSFLFHDPYPINMREAPKYFAEYLPAHVTPIPQEEWPARFAEHVKRYRTKRVACYCNTCTTAARQGGADAHHLASLIFG